MVIGILVSPDYDNISKIKSKLGEIKAKASDVEVCQITDNGKYDEIKKFVLNIGLKYSEVLKYDERNTMYSHDSNSFKFNRPYNPKYFHVRNSKFLSYVDGICGFIAPTLKKTDATYMILSKAKSKKMNLKIFN